jgi:hypothetical protein
LGSIQYFIVTQTSWTAFYFIAAFVFSRKGMVVRWAGLIWIVAIFQGFLSLWEHRVGHVLWLGHIPSFLQVSDESVAGILQPKIRGNAYRSQGTFDGPIQLGEYMVLCFTFVLHFAVEGRTLLTRVLARISAPFLLVTAVASGSRSSAIGFAVALGLYAGYYAARHWRRSPQSLVAPIFIFAYPIMGVAAFASTFLIYRIRAAVWGTGIAAASSQARAEQWAQAIPKIISRPWGWGAGQANDVVAYSTPGADFYTLDCYYISLIVDYGFVGLILYVAIFITAGCKALYFIVFDDHEEWEVGFLAPAGVSLIGFLVTKMVFNQTDNHPLFFSVLGMASALLWRAQQEKGAEVTIRGGAKRRSPRQLVLEHA